MSELNDILTKIESVTDMINSSDKEIVWLGVTKLKTEDWYQQFIESCQDEAVVCRGFYRIQDIDKKIDSLTSREFEMFSLLWDEDKESYLKKPILLLLERVTIFYQEKLGAKL